MRTCLAIFIWVGDRGVLHHPSPVRGVVVEGYHCRSRKGSSPFNGVARTTPMTLCETREPLIVLCGKAQS